MLWKVQLKSWHVEMTQRLHVTPDVMICAVNVATWELSPLMLLKKLVVRPTDLLSLVTVEWCLKNAAMGEVIIFLCITLIMKHSELSSLATKLIFCLLNGSG